MVNIPVIFSIEINDLKLLKYQYNFFIFIYFIFLYNSQSKISIRKKGDRAMLQTTCLVR